MTDVACLAATIAAVDDVDVTTSRPSRRAVVWTSRISSTTAGPSTLTKIAMARPGGNVTGLSIQQTDVAAKRLELLREFVPGLRRLVAKFLNRSCALSAPLESMLLGVPPQNPFSTASVRLGHFGDVGPVSGLPESGHG